MSVSEGNPSRETRFTWKNIRNISDIRNIPDDKDVFGYLSRIWVTVGFASICKGHFMANPNTSQFFLEIIQKRRHQLWFSKTVSHFMIACLEFLSPRNPKKPTPWEVKSGRGLPRSEVRLFGKQSPDLPSPYLRAMEVGVDEGGGDVFVCHWNVENGFRMVKIAIFWRFCGGWGKGKIVLLGVLIPSRFGGHWNFGSNLACQEDRWNNLCRFITMQLQSIPKYLNICISVCTWYSVYIDTILMTVLSVPWIK